MNFTKILHLSSKLRCSYENKDTFASTRYSRLSSSKDNIYSHYSDSIENLKSISSYSHKYSQPSLIKPILNTISKQVVHTLQIPKTYIYTKINNLHNKLLLHFGCKNKYQDIIRSINREVRSNEIANKKNFESFNIEKYYFSCIDTIINCNQNLQEFNRLKPTLPYMELDEDKNQNYIIEQIIKNGYIPKDKALAQKTIINFVDTYKDILVEYTSQRNYSFEQIKQFIQNQLIHNSFTVHAHSNKESLEEYIANKQTSVIELVEKYESHGHVRERDFVLQHLEKAKDAWLVTPVNYEILKERVQQKSPQGKYCQKIIDAIQNKDVFNGHSISTRDKYNYFLKNCFRLAHSSIKITTQEHEAQDKQIFLYMKAQSEYIKLRKNKQINISFKKFWHLQSMNQGYTNCKKFSIEELEELKQSRLKYFESSIYNKFDLEKQLPFDINSINILENIKQLEVYKTDENLKQKIDNLYNSINNIINSTGVNFRDCLEGNTTLEEAIAWIKRTPNFNTNFLLKQQIHQQEFNLKIHEYCLNPNTKDKILQYYNLLQNSYSDDIKMEWIKQSNIPIVDKNLLLNLLKQKI